MKEHRIVLKFTMNDWLYQFVETDRKGRDEDQDFSAYLVGAMNNGLSHRIEEAIQHWRNPHYIEQAALTDNHAAARSILAIQVVVEGGGDKPAPIPIMSEP